MDIWVSKLSADFFIKSELLL